MQTLMIGTTHTATMVDDLVLVHDADGALVLDSTDDDAVALAIAELAATWQRFSLAMRTAPSVRSVMLRQIEREGRESMLDVEAGGVRITCVDRDLHNRRLVEISTGTSRRSADAPQSEAWAAIAERLHVMRRHMALVAEQEIAV